MHHSYIDRFSRGDTPVHRLDARVKLVAVLAYTGVLVSFDRQAVSVLAPLAVAPLAMLETKTRCPPAVSGEAIFLVNKSHLL